jgi:hypothetical protein
MRRTNVVENVKALAATAQEKGVGHPRSLHRRGGAPGLKLKHPSSRD